MLSYWVNIHFNNRNVGFGFFLVRAHVVTAAHCLTDHSVKEGDTLVVRTEDHAEFSATVRQIDVDHDVAVLEVQISGEYVSRALQPLAPQLDARWRSPNVYRDVNLHGYIREVDRDVTCASGETVPGLQLLVEEDLGDYSGHSGSPIEVQSPAVGPVGLLIRQVGDRVDTERYTRILFAVRLNYLFAAYPALSGDLAVAPTAIEDVVRAESLGRDYLREMREMSESGRLPVQAVDRLASELDAFVAELRRAWE